MPYAIELFFDSDADARIRKIWAALARARICDYLFASPSRPHVSLSVFDHDDEASMIDLVRTCATSCHRFPVEFLSPARFPDTTISFLPVGRSPAFDELQHSVHAKIMTHGARVWPNYEPICWIPHCTLAMHATPEHDLAVRDIATTYQPRHATVVSIGLVRFHPTMHVAEFVVGK